MYDLSSQFRRHPPSEDHTAVILHTAVDGPAVTSGGGTGDPTATAALRRDPVRDALAEVVRNLDTMHRAAVAAAAAVERLGVSDLGSPDE